MPKTEHALSILTPDMDHPGLFNGVVHFLPNGAVAAEYITTSADEGTAFHAVRRFITAEIANSAAECLARLMPPGTSIQRVEIVSEA